MPLIARLGDAHSHGGTIISSCSKTYANGALIARKGDLIACPFPGHGINPIVQGSSNFYCEGAQVAYVGAACACGAVITTGGANSSTGV